MSSYLDPIHGRECTRLTIDRFAPPLVLWFMYDGPTGRVEISGPFQFGSGPSVLRLDPSDAVDRSRLGPVLRLVGQSVASATVSDRETLRLEFSGGAWIEVDDQPDIEAWYFEMERKEDPGATEP